jgi:hypothetical protein
MQMRRSRVLYLLAVFPILFSVAWASAQECKVEKVIAFYKKQPGLNFVGGDQGGGMLRKGNVDVTVQSPWMDTKTGKMEKDTLISIVKNKE